MLLLTAENQDYTDVGLSASYTRQMDVQHMDRIVAKAKIRAAAS